ncbi:MAG TPA: methionyl-tRNA formyltransferase [Candidatus Limnocylindrales bacterium]|nr:methionyl-tRNA formyltransferase [Candidatus Limnocylindrales bacterium]
MSAAPRAVFFGSGAFAVPVLAAAAASPAIRLVGVVTAPARPTGRHREVSPTPVGRHADSLGLSILAPASLRGGSALADLAHLRPELLLVADYGRLLPPVVLDVGTRGALNVQPSLLPRWRGASPIAASILAGDAETGVTVILMDAGLDTGPIVASRQVALEGTEVAPALEARLAAVGAELLTQTLGRWLAGEIVPQPQRAAGATVSRTLRREDGRLAPSQPAVQLERQVRAFQPWPGSFLEIDGSRLTVWRAVATAIAVGHGAADAAEPGRLIAADEGLALVTTAGNLVLLEVQPAGGRRMSGAELRRGRPGLVGGRVAVVDRAPTVA